MGDMKVTKRRKKDTAVEATEPTPKVAVKTARPTDDAIGPAMMRSDQTSNGHVVTTANGRNSPSRDYAGNAATQAVDENERRRLIAEAAYFRAVRRNFANGTPEGDWLEAEAEVGAWLSQQRT